MQLLKWLFAILVILNIAVFANVVTQKMNGNRPTQSPAVVAVPIGTGIAAETAANTTGAAPAAHMAQAPSQNVRREAAPVAVSKTAPNCSAQITLPEDAYHRLKNFIGGYRHAVARNVVENKQATKKPKLQYQVLAAGSSEETMAALNKAGINATAQGASLSLGVFSSADKAQAVRQRAIAAGVAGVVINERGNEEAAALTSANYTVTFSDVSGQDVSRIQEVLGRYGRLQRSACAK